MNRTALTVMVTMVVLSSCMNYSSDFTVNLNLSDQLAADGLVAAADQCAISAQDGASVKKCISLYQKAAEADASNYRALVMQANLYLLLGDGYEQSRSQKAAHFKNALKFTEQAMYLNPDFRVRIARGEKVWQACTALTEKEVDAMVFWVTAVFYYYKECLGPLGQAINFAWIKRAESVLSNAEALNPQWGGGIIYLSWGLYYLSIPEMVGGDRKKSAQYFTKAITTGPDYLVNRWARAKYFHVKMGNQTQFTQDLQWVLHQDLQQASDHMAWKYFFVKDARELLKKKETLF